MRLPNGYGCIRKLSGKRRRPYHVAKLIGYKTDDEKRKELPVYETIGYAATRADALQMLAEYNKDPYDLNRKELTFKDVFDEWYEVKKETVSESRKSAIRTAVKYFEPIYRREFRGLKTRDFEALARNIPRTTRVTAKVIISQMYKYALRYEYCDKDYSVLLDFKPDTKTRTEKNVFTPEEISKIKLLENDLRADMVLLSLYSGIRPMELFIIETDNVNLEERYFITGVKTESGKNRIVPIHKNVYNRVEHAYGIARERGSKYLFTQLRSGRKLSKESYRTIFNQICDNHVPYDTRHTFITYAKKSRIDEYILKRIVGHSIADITERVYTHLSPKDLADEIDKVVLE